MISPYMCACGHLITLEPSDVDGRVLWFHNAPGCTCRSRPGCGGPPPPAGALVAAVSNGSAPDSDAVAAQRLIAEMARNNQPGLGSIRSLLIAEGFGDEERFQHP